MTMILRWGAILVVVAILAVVLLGPLVRDIRAHLHWRRRKREIFRRVMESTRKDEP